MNVSFYSYKGGVGRTQLCANLASFLCYYKDMKILLWDWDFEAPGLHIYFDIEEIEISGGTLELLEDYLKLMRGGEKVTEKDLSVFSEEKILNVTSTDGEGKIDLIAAGNYSNNYASRLIDFHWYEFLEKYDGAAYVEFLKEHINQLDYDFVFIDARTGISDYAGICNILLPDVNVVIVGPNEQSFRGNKLIIDRIINHPYIVDGNITPKILPILSRLDEQDTNKLQVWINKFMDVFSDVIPVIEKARDYLDEEKLVREFLDKTCLPHSPILALGENILFSKTKKEVFSFGFQNRYINIANCFCDLKDYGYITLEDDDIKKKVISTKVSSFTIEEGNKLLDKAHQRNISFEESINLYKKAKNVFRELLEYHPKSYELLEGLGKSFIGLKDYETALSTFERMSISGTNSEVWVLKARCMIELGRYDEINLEKLNSTVLEKTLFDEKSLLNDVIELATNMYIEDGDQGKGLQIINLINSRISEVANKEWKSVDPD